MREFKGIRRDRLKIRFGRPEGEISRRELLKLVIPRYEVVPFIEPDLCQGSQQCGLCIDACPLEAIKTEADEVIVDTTLCSGCGACIITCPQRAIIYPTFLLERLDEEMAGLCSAGGTLPEPGIIALTCQNCIPLAGEEERHRFTYPPGVSGLKVPCLAMASPWLMLRAFDRGARGLALLANRRKCPVGASNRWQDDIRFVQALLSGWDIDPERIRVFDVADQDVLDAKAELEKFAREIAGLTPTSLGVSGPTLVPDEGLLLPALIRGLANKSGCSSPGEVRAGMVPFGKLELDASQCIGCGLCAVDCPTEALTASSNEETDSFQLSFQHDRCVACGRCVKVCPEKCLRLERILELSQINSPAAVLFEDSIARCRECGNVIGARAMIDRLQAKVLPIGEALAAQLELCPACKTRQFSLGRTDLGPVNKPELDGRR